MSIYGPKIKFPRIGLPNISLPKPKVSLKVLGIILIIIIVLATIVFFASNPDLFDSHINVSWKNNPLDLKSDLAQNAELTLILTNTSETVQDIELEVTTESKELIVFCPYTTFENVEPQNNRKVTCLIKRNPQENIFAGNYTLTIKTNLGEARAVLEVRT